jgi:hypothetical protein
MTDRKNKMAVEILAPRGVVACLHVGRKWSMQRITKHIDDVSNECGGQGVPLIVETFNFGDRGRPLRRFERDRAGKWIETKARVWSKDRLDARDRFFHEMVQQASKGE